MYGTERGLSARSEVRAEINELITQLEACNPNPSPNEVSASQLPGGGMGVGACAGCCCCVAAASAQATQQAKDACCHASAVGTSVRQLPTAPNNPPPPMHTRIACLTTCIWWPHWAALVSWPSPRPYIHAPTKQTLPPARPTSTPPSPAPL